MYIKLLIITLLFSSLYSKHLHYEKYYQKIFCNKINGVMEYTLYDNTRVDCLTSTYAIEVDFANKWAESIGQSLYYSIETGKSAAVLLIIESPKDIHYLKRFRKVSKQHDIQLFTIDKDLNIRRY